MGMAGSWSSRVGDPAYEEKWKALASRHAGSCG